MLDKVGSNRCTRFSCCQLGFDGAENGQWDPVTGLGTINYQVCVCVGDDLLSGTGEVPVLALAKAQIPDNSGQDFPERFAWAALIAVCPP